MFKLYSEVYRWSRDEDVLDFASPSIYVIVEVDDPPTAVFLFTCYEWAEKLLETVSFENIVSYYEAKNDV